MGAMRSVLPERLNMGQSIKRWFDEWRNGIGDHREVLGSAAMRHRLWHHNMVVQATDPDAEEGNRG